MLLCRDGLVQNYISFITPKYVELVGVPCHSLISKPATLILSLCCDDEGEGPSVRVERSLFTVHTTAGDIDGEISGGDHCSYEEGRPALIVSSTSW